MDTAARLHDSRVCGVRHSIRDCVSPPPVWNHTSPKTEHTFEYVPVTVRVCFPRGRVVRLSDVGCVWQARGWWMAPTTLVHTRQEGRRQSAACFDLKGWERLSSHKVEFPLKTHTKWGLKEVCAQNTVKCESYGWLTQRIWVVGFCFCFFTNYEFCCVV